MLFKSQPNTQNADAWERFLGAEQKTVPGKNVKAGEFGGLFSTSSIDSVDTAGFLSKESLPWKKGNVTGLKDWPSQVALLVKNMPANPGHIRDVGLISGLRRFLGEGNGNPLQNSCLGNHMDRGA